MAMPFGALLMGRWVTRDIMSKEHPGWLASSMVLVSGILVFGSSLIFFLLKPLRTGFMGMGHVGVLIGFACAALVFFFLVARSKVLAGLIVTLCAVAASVWCLAWLNPAGQWEHKLSFMQGISRNSPLAVYNDDLIMRGYMSAVGSKGAVISRDIVPMEDTAFLAVSTGDLDELVDTLKARMQPVILDTYRAENTYALVMISPKKRNP
jgi:hypothetical protein